MKPLQNKVALITGASLGIGRAIALEMASLGADVVINYRSHPDDAQSAADEVTAYGQKALIAQADVADRGAQEKMFASALEVFGHIDIVVANAAFSVREPVLEAKWENVLKVIEASQFGVFHTCQFAAQQMVRQAQSGNPGGKILIISSILAEIAPAGSAAYNMSKAAINHLCHTMALELAPHHINVNVINPGWIDTPGERHYADEKAIQAGGKRIPWGRLGSSEDIAKASAFLCGPDSDYITGATLRVDGGFVLGLSLPEVHD